MLLLKSVAESESISYCENLGPAPILIPVRAVPDSYTTQALVEEILLTKKNVHVLT